MGTYLVLLDCSPQSHFQIGMIFTYVMLFCNILTNFNDVLTLLSAAPTELQASIDGYTYSLHTSGHPPPTFHATLNPITSSTVATADSNTTTSMHTANYIVTASTPTTHPITTDNTTTNLVATTPTIYAQRYAQYLTKTGQRIYRSATAEVKDKNDEEVTVVVELLLTETEGTILHMSLPTGTNF